MKFIKEMYARYRAMDSVDRKAVRVVATVIVILLFVPLLFTCAG